MKNLLFYMLTLISLMNCIDLSAEQSLERFRDIYTDNNKDTILVDRIAGNWRIGAFGGINLEQYFGSFFNYQNPFLPPSSVNKKLEFSGGTGSGYMIGIGGEYLPDSTNWGWYMKLYLFEKRSGKSETDKMNDVMNSKYEFDADMQYFNIGVGTRYKLPYYGFYTSGGIDIEINTSSELKHSQKFINTGTIVQTSKIPIKNTDTRIAVNLGLGYEFFSADIARKYRATISPYFNLSVGSKAISDLGSTWNLVSMRAGVSVSFSKDKTVYDTLKFNADYFEEPVQYAFAQENKVSFIGFKHVNPLPGVDLAVIEKPEIIENVEQEPVIAKAIKEKKFVPEPPPVRLNEIDVTKLKTFSFASSSSVELSSDVKAYLNSVIKYLQDNPNAEIRIIGHSDNQGSLTENTQRSRERALAASDYLIQKGINRRKILVQWRGSLVALAPNNTEDGRRKNRRVEIVVVPKR